MNKMWHLHTTECDSVIKISNKQNFYTCYKIDEPQNDYAEQKKLHKRSWILVLGSAAHIQK